MCGIECTYCHKKGQAKYKLKTQKYYKVTEKEKTNVSVDIYHDELLFGDDALAWENKTINKKIDQMFVTDS